MQIPKQEYPAATTLFCSVIIGALLSPLATLAEVNNGELAAAIRSANYPCTHVVSVDSKGDNAWVVQCNSGSFYVSRDQNGDLRVNQED